LSGPRFDAQSIKERMVEGLRPALRVLLAAVVVVLMIVCANVANLLLARGASRERELAVRTALGASRGRVARQVLTESIVLAVVGGLLGAVVAGGGVALVKQLVSVDAPGIFRLGFGTSILPRGHELAIDPRMFAIAFVVAAVTSIACGVLPALHLSRPANIHAVGARCATGSRTASRVRTALVVGHLVMATVLLVGAGLLIHSFVKLSSVDRGYDPSNVLSLQLVFPTDYPIARKVDTIETVLSRLRAAPDVQAAGFTRAGILIGEEITRGTFVPPGRSVDEMRSDPVRPLIRPVSDGYLTATGVRVLAGRDFVRADAERPTTTVVISQSVAQRYFGGASSVGQTIEWYVAKQRRPGAAAAPPVQLPAAPLEVIGVVEDVRNTAPDRQPPPEIFINYRQMIALERQWDDSAQLQETTSIGFLSFAVRTRGNPTDAAPIVERIVRSVDPSAGIDALIPMERLVSSSVARPRFYAVVLGVFAIVAGFLAAIGVYGVLAYAVAQRTQEIGIRMALGAQRAQVLALVLRTGLMLTAVGIALGLAAAVAGTRLLQGMLFGITPLDPRTFIAVSLLFALVAALASYVPARRATKVDPMVALRSE